MSKWCIGIDLGGTFIKFGLLNEQLQPAEIFQLPTPTTGAAAVVAQMIAGAKTLMDRHKLAPADVVGVGIGSPGPIRISEGIVIALPNIPGMNNVPLRDEVANGLGIQAVLENDANAAAYGEFIAGAGKGSGDMVMLTLGTGVGSGIIIGGKLLHGRHEIGGEFGHIIVQPGGERCGCGQQGCLERYASATFMAQRAQRMIEIGGLQSSLKDVLAKTGTITSRDINDARKAGDALAARVWDEACQYLAQACVNICRIFDPDEIVLAGGLTQAGEDLLTPLRAHYERMHWTLTKPMTPVVIATLGSNAGAIGAAGVAWASFAKA